MCITGYVSCIWNDMEDKDRKMIKKELDLYRKKGVGPVSGRERPAVRETLPGPARWRNMAPTCGDYCQDDKGNLKRINFTFIEDKE